MLVIICNKTCQIFFSYLFKNLIWAFLLLHCPINRSHHWNINSNWLFFGLFVLWCWKIWFLICGGWWFQVRMLIGFTLVHTSMYAVVTEYWNKSMYTFLILKYDWIWSPLYSCMYVSKICLKCCTTKFWILGNKKFLC